MVYELQQQFLTPPSSPGSISSSQKVKKRSSLVTGCSIIEKSNRSDRTATTEEETTHEASPRILEPKSASGTLPLKDQTPTRTRPGRDSSKKKKRSNSAPSKVKRSSIKSKTEEERQKNMATILGTQSSSSTASSGRPKTPTKRSSSSKRNNKVKSLSTRDRPSKKTVTEPPRTVSPRRKRKVTLQRSSSIPKFMQLVGGSEDLLSSTTPATTTEKKSTDNRKKEIKTTVTTLKSGGVTPTTTTTTTEDNQSALEKVTTTSTSRPQQQQQEKRSSIWDKVAAYEAAAKSSSPTRQQQQHERPRPMILTRSNSVPKFMQLVGDDKDNFAMDHQQAENAKGGGGVTKRPLHAGLAESAKAPSTTNDLRPRTPTKNRPTSTPRKKGSILKQVPENETTQAATALNEDDMFYPESPHCGKTLLVNKNKISDDDVTCLTMDDFLDETEDVPTNAKKRASTPKKKSSSLRKNTSSPHRDPYTRTASGNLSDAGLAEILRKDIHSKKEPVLIAGLEAIHEFVNRGGNKQRATNKLVSFGAIPSILRVLERTKKYTSTSVFLSAVGALEKITLKNPKHQQTACELGAIPILVLAIQRHLTAPKAVGAACKVLDTITSCLRIHGHKEEDDDHEHEHSQEDVPMEGAMTVLSCCLLTHSKNDNKDVLTYGIGAIFNICWNRRDQMQMLSEAGGIEAIKSALQSSSKWKSKTRKTQAQKDFKRVSVLLSSSSKEKYNMSDYASSTDEEEDDEES